MAKPQKSTAQSEVPGLVKKGPLYYLKRDWQLYALMLLPMVFIIVFKYFAYTGLSVAFLDYKIGKGYAGSKFVGCLHGQLFGMAHLGRDRHVQPCYQQLDQ